MIIAFNSEPAYYINLVVGTRCGTDEETSIARLLWAKRMVLFRGVLLARVLTTPLKRG